jgi:hypothetical protein
MRTQFLFNKPRKREKMITRYWLGTLTLVLMTFQVAVVEAAALPTMNDWNNLQSAQLTAFNAAGVILANTAAVQVDQAAAALVQAQITQQQANESALFAAIANNDAAGATTLLATANPYPAAPSPYTILNARMADSGYITPLMYAVMTAGTSADLVTALLNAHKTAGISLELQDATGNTAAHYAASSPTFAVQLFTSGANFNALNAINGGIAHPNYTPLQASTNAVWPIYPDTARAVLQAAQNPPANSTIVPLTKSNLNAVLKAANTYLLSASNPGRSDGYAAAQATADFNVIKTIVTALIPNAPTP